ncbi:DNA polymerase III subunit epsilon [Siccirubricoccus sp. KC 17139]|uniref:DNA polymerase III subunit epsilon n=1 Tax=Siccirubricoccus soli TaxID=2899147 RepID=A0ABT1D3F2_9PROT|nr:DNA polymerase III subunit epsilon [Siccirubricoccus soli]MCO6416456.1 DNA polymerase III subunit epsilon [Siccirubricoccus soli]MCP2682590.1 DNA polymerase III subunit epsilon [Siccirubricoccus soli]
MNNGPEARNLVGLDAHTGLRCVVLDTETTGLDPQTGDRVLEVAAIELINLIPTDRTFHTLVNPERDVPEEATRVHGFTAAMLQDKPKFAEIAEAMLEFLGDSPIVAHNAPFDFGFLDAELKRLGRPPLDRARMVDSLALAKKRFPGMPNSLDALCRRYEIDNSMRTSHNALLDVKLLAQVFLELMGGKQPGLELATARRAPSAEAAALLGQRTPRPIIPSEAELAAHAAFLKKLKEPLWLQPPFVPAEG